MSLMEQIRHDISKLSERGLASLTDVQLLTNLLLCERCLMDKENEPNEPNEPVIPKHAEALPEHNHVYDRDINALYDAYLSARSGYEKETSDRNKQSMLIALNSLASELTDLLCTLNNSAIFEDEREILRKITYFIEN